MPATDTDPVTVVYSWRARPGHEDEFADWAKQATTVASRFPGNLSATVLHEDGARDFHLIHQFDTRRHLEDWIDSDERTRLLRKAKEVAAARTAVQRRTGLETWFHVPSEAAATMRPPPRWKMWLISLAAIYPLVLLFQAFLNPLIASWPLPLRAAMFPLILLTTMTYGVMPLVTRLLRPWL
jgi:antibiotic biosynthesis monooxygenase (ABM) superfamily enzyme